jgi:hypothetical protein
MPIVAFTAGSLGDILATAGIIVKITRALHDSGISSAECRALRLELQSLHTTLILVDCAVKRYRGTELGQILANLIEAEVSQCQEAMKPILDKINDYEHALVLTSIRALWRKVVWAAASEAEMLRMKLSTHQGKLAMLLAALNSFVFFMSSFRLQHINMSNFRVAFAELQGEMQSICVLVKEVHASVRYGPHVLGHIKETTVRVVDPLGSTISVPTLFCSRWEVRFEFPHTGLVTLHSLAGF